jgi:hypothetical protein
MRSVGIIFLDLIPYWYLTESESSCYVTNCMRFSQKRVTRYHPILGEERAFSDVYVTSVIRHSAGVCHVC